MGGTVRARLKGGNLELLETIDLPEGKEVTVTILDVPSKTDDELSIALPGHGKTSLTQRN